MSKIKLFLLFSAVFIMSFVVGNLVLGWVEPTQPPPQGNVAVPLNTSATPQSKTGNLSAPALYDVSEPSYYIDPNGVTILKGPLGIGTTNPGTNKLEVVGGPIKTTGGLIIETRTSDPASPIDGQIWLRTDL